MCSCFHFQFDLNESIDKKSVPLLCFLVQFVLYIGPFLLETIGVSKLHNNLYLLSTTSCKLDSAVSSILDSIFGTFVNNVSDIPVITKPYLWHLRLGHALDDKLHALHDCGEETPTHIEHCKSLEVPVKCASYFLGWVCLNCCVDHQQITFFHPRQQNTFWKAL